MENNIKLQIKNKPNYDITAIILTAGYSSRMGLFKPLLRIGDKTAIECVIRSLADTGVDQITAVVGYKKELLRQLLIDKRVRAVYNSRFDEGMFTSIQTGIKATLDVHIKGFLLFLVDCPLVPPEIIMKVIEAHREHPDSFIVPCFKGKKGHPLLIPKQYAKEILDYDGDGGLKAITSKYDDKMIKIEVDDESVVLDMDTKEGYEEILQYYQQHKDSKEKSISQIIEQKNITPSYIDIAKKNKIKRLFLLRHGQIEQHKDKIFLGQADIPLSELGKQEARIAGENLFEEGTKPKFIYCSDLLRAKETAEQIVDVFSKKMEVRSKINIIDVPAFREMNLGPWDGKLISEIKDTYPEEYIKRGKNLLAYKYGNESENFFDLQYRVMKGFKRILQNHKSEDLLIVTHAGVIQVILANLQDLTLAEAIKKKIHTGQMIKIDFTKR